MSNTLELGWLLDQHGKVLGIASESIAHHTAILAQSGAGKSFLLGRLIEEILLKTRARVLILDSNGDFRNVHKVGDKAWDKNEKAHTGWDPLPPEDYPTRKNFENDWEKKIDILQATLRQNDVPPNAVKPLVKWSDLDARQQAEILDVGIAYNTSELYPVLELLRILTLSKSKAVSPLEFVKEIQTKKSVDFLKEIARTLTSTLGGFSTDILLKNSNLKDYAEQLIRFLRALDKFGIWATAESGYSIRELIVNAEPRNDLVVIDLPGMRKKEARLVVVNYILDALWEAAVNEWDMAFEMRPEKDTRVPLLIVVDEAHNFVPANTTDALTEHTAQTLLKMAAEGRKYGIFLMVITQRPAKLRHGLLSECENLCLLRLQSPVEHKLVFDTWGIPQSELDRVSRFKKGDAMLYGVWSPSPTVFHSAYRRTQEGGANLREKHWAQKRI